MGELHHEDQILHDFAPRLRVYTSGRIERLLKDDTVSPSFDPTTRVTSKHITISATLSARLYLPENSPENTKLPVVIYIHGGAFCLYSAASSIYQTHLNSLASESQSLVVSIDYRLAPEHPMPACYDDSWAVSQWVAAHSSGSGPDPWLNDRADFNRVYLAGDSAGANIAHDVMVRAGPGGDLGSGVKVAGLVMVHPFFGDEETNELWNFLYPGTSGVYDPRLNPAADPARMRMGLKGCGRVLVCVGGKDFLRERGVKYYEVLREGGWEGEVEFMESKGRGHVFHLYKPGCDEAVELVKRVALFINSDKKSS